MIKLLQYIVSGCSHKWKTIDVSPFSWNSDISSGTGTRYTLCCEKCGKITKKDIR